MSTSEPGTAGPTVSDQIRALAARGHSRAEIARLLGKRYQHVRNVLEADKVCRDAQSAPAEAAAVAGFEESPATWGGVHRLMVDADGSARLPAEVVAALAASAGGVLIGELEADRFVILSRRAAWLKVRTLVASQGVDSDRMLSELVAERRAEAAQDGDG